MPKTVLKPENLEFQPRPTYPYSPGAIADGVIYTAGQVAWNNRAEIVGPGNPALQARQALSNIRSILEAGGASMSDVQSCTIYLTDMRSAGAVMIEFEKAFGERAPPATLVRARLAEAEMLVEIEAEAVIG
jgi:enamine deaminase RidA (YjgF/YER057c/UK114 family)